MDIQYKQPKNSFFSKWKLRKNSKRTAKGEVYLISLMIKLYSRLLNIKLKVGVQICRKSG